MSRTFLLGVLFLVSALSIIGCYDSHEGVSLQRDASADGATPSGDGAVPSTTVDGVPSALDAGASGS